MNTLPTFTALQYFTAIKAAHDAEFFGWRDMLIAMYRKEYPPVNIQYQPTPGSVEERELIAAYDRPGHEVGD